MLVNFLFYFACVCVYIFTHRFVVAFSKLKLRKQREKVRESERKKKMQMKFVMTLVENSVFLGLHNAKLFNEFQVNKRCNRSIPNKMERKGKGRDGERIEDFCFHRSCSHT